MTTWEYRIESIDSLPTVTSALRSYLDQLGIDGWELVSIGVGPTIWQRPRPDNADQRKQF